MNLSAKEFSVDFVGSLKTPEIKKNLVWPAQNPLFLFRQSKGISEKEAKTLWETLPDTEKQPFCATSLKQKDLCSEIKILSKKLFSLTFALAETEKSLSKVKEEYSSLRVNTATKTASSRRRNNFQSRGRAAFQAFSKSWKEKNNETEGTARELRLLVSEAWKKMTPDEKKVYYN